VARIRVGWILTSVEFLRILYSEKNAAKPVFYHWHSQLRRICPFVCPINSNRLERNRKQSGAYFSNVLKQVGKRTGFVSRL
jgi:hypothetical protein